jgi:hypothetical protein
VANAHPKSPMIFVKLSAIENGYKKVSDNNNNNNFFFLKLNKWKVSKKSEDRDERIVIIQKNKEQRREVRRGKWVGD